MITMAGTLHALFGNMTDAAPAQAWGLNVFGRLVGRPASDGEIADMNEKIASGRAEEAFEGLTRKSDFINLTARAFCQPMSTRSERPDVPMNEFTASCMGAIRDDRPATELLAGNFYYEFDRTKSPYDTSVTDYFQRNQHYETTEGQEVNGFDFAQFLVRREGQQVPKLPADRYSVQPITETVPQPEPAGLLTTHTWSREHAEGGTNRRLVEYAFREFLCKPIGEFADTSAPDHWIGRDVSRAPGGNPQIFQSSCRGCHALLDGMRGAFAYTSWGFRGQVSQKPPAAATLEVGEKYARNSDVYPNGYATRDSSWENLATTGTNAEFFGWRGATKGVGMSEFGQMLARSRAFSRCMVVRVVQTVCLRPTTFEDEQALLAPEAEKFETDGYNLRRLFARVAARRDCIDPTQGN